MVHVQKRIYIGLFVLQYFTTRQWDFKTENYRNIYRSLTESEKIMFEMDTEKIDTAIYLKKLILGGRQYCMKEPLSTLPKARIHLKL